MVKIYTYFYHAYLGVILMRACVSRSTHMYRIGETREIQVAGCAYESFSLGRPCRRQRVPSGLKLAVRLHCAAIHISRVRVSVRMCFQVRNSGQNLTSYF